MEWMSHSCVAAVEWQVPTSRPLATLRLLCCANPAVLRCAPAGALHRVPLVRQHHHWCSVCLSPAVVCRTALQWACRWGHVEAARVLLEA